MVNERPQQFSGFSRFGGPVRPTISQSTGPLPSSSNLPRTPGHGGSQHTRPGLGLGAGGLGRGKSLKRHRKVQRDSIQGITKGDIRRLARRGGVKRISATIYSDIRLALKERLRSILQDCVVVLESSGRITVSVTDIVFVLNRRGYTLYGFEPSFTGTRR